MHGRHTKVRPHHWVAGAVAVLVAVSVGIAGAWVIHAQTDGSAARRGNRILYLKDGVIMNECHLGKYIPQDQERHEKLRHFLTEMGW